MKQEVQRGKSTLTDYKTGNVGLHVRSKNMLRKKTLCRASAPEIIALRLSGCGAAQIAAGDWSDVVRLITESRCFRH